MYSGYGLLCGDGEGVKYFRGRLLIGTPVPSLHLSSVYTNNYCILRCSVMGGGSCTKKVRRKKGNLARTYLDTHCHLDWRCAQMALSCGGAVPQ